MHALAALSYADRHALLNELRSLRTRPWRLAVWGFWLLFVVMMVALRGMGAGNTARAMGAWQTVIDDGAVALFAASFGHALAAGGTRLGPIFRTRAEPLLTVRAAYAPPLVTAYLQARTAALTVLRTLAAFAYILVVALPDGAGVLGFARTLALLCATVVAIAAAPLLRALARGPARSVCVVAGSAAAALAVVPLVGDALTAFPRHGAAWNLARRLPAWHPGYAIVRTAAGDLMPLLGCTAVAVTMILLFVAAARDAYPELYTLSLAALESRGTAKAARAASAAPPLRGASALLWVDFVTSRRRVSPLSLSILVLCALGAGALLGVFYAQTDRDAAFLTGTAIIVNVFIAASATTTVRVASDLRRPLWWLGAAPVAHRLLAWTFAPLWHDLLFLSLAATGAAASTADVRFALGLVTCGFAVAILARAAAIAIFALLPAALDQRGPAVAFRLALCYALIVPALLAGVLAGVVFASTASGVAAAIVAALGEGGLLVTFAARRLNGRIDLLAAS